MDVSELFQDMYSDDIEGQKLKEIPEVQEILILYPCVHYVLKSIITYMNVIRHWLMSSNDNSIVHCFLGELMHSNVLMLRNSR